MPYRVTELQADGTAVGVEITERELRERVEERRSGGWRPGDPHVPDVALFPCPHCSAVAGEPCRPHKRKRYQRPKTNPYGSDPMCWHLGADELGSDMQRDARPYCCFHGKRFGVYFRALDAGEELPDVEPVHLQQELAL